VRAGRARVWCVSAQSVQAVHAMSRHGQRQSVHGALHTRALRPPPLPAHRLTPPRTVLMMRPNTQALMQLVITS
jgi:hypothetical protein